MFSEETRGSQKGHILQFHLVRGVSTDLRLGPLPPVPLGKTEEDIFCWLNRGMACLRP